MSISNGLIHLRFAEFMLTVPSAGRLVRAIAPAHIESARLAWELAASGMLGEDAEIVALLSVARDAGCISRSELHDLGATDKHLDFEPDVEPVSPDDGASVLVLRRHAEPGRRDGLSDAGQRSARALASTTRVDFVICGPSLRTRSTAAAWTSQPLVVDAFGLPAADVERAVGIDAGFLPWSRQPSISEYTREVARATAEHMRPGRVGLIITHNGVPQAALAGLAIAPSALSRVDSLGHLEGIVITRLLDGAHEVRRLGAPPIDLYG